jgi:hypothetical protein
MLQQVSYNGDVLLDPGSPFSRLASDDMAELHDIYTRAHAAADEVVSTPSDVGRSPRNQMIRDKEDNDEDVWNGMLSTGSDLPENRMQQLKDKIFDPTFLLARSAGFLCLLVAVLLFAYAIPPFFTIGDVDGACVCV